MYLGQANANFNNLLDNGPTDIVTADDLQELQAFVNQFLVNVFWSVIYTPEMFLITSP